LIVFLFPVLGLASPPQTEEQKSALAIQDAIFHRQIGQAEQLLISSSPDSPLPYLVRLTIMQAKMFENFAFFKEAAFLAESAKSEAICEKMLANTAADHWNLLVCGASDALRAFFHLKNRQSFKAVKVAGRGLKLLERAKTADPDSVDVDLGFGLYEFFKSEFMQTKLSFIPFIKDNRAQALAKIERVATTGTYGRDLAQFCLAFIALETERRDLGDRTFPKLIARFPESVLFRVLYAAFLIKVEDFAGAVAHLTQLMNMAPEITAAKYFMGRALVLEGKKLAEAKNYLSEYLQTEPDASVKGPSYYLLGIIAEREGNTKEALGLYQEAHDIYPYYKPSLKNLLRLRQQTDLKTSLRPAITPVI
jgi:tetratricopeptide (TPR) repeat protein